MASPDEDEYPLARPVRTPLWSENYALALADRQSGLTFLLSIGTWHGDTSIWREKLSIVLPSGKRLVARNYGRGTQGAVVSAALARYEIVTPQQRIHFTFNGPVWEYDFAHLMEKGMTGGLGRMLSTDIAFDAVSPLWDMHGDHARDETGIMGALHTEQIGRCSGSLVYDGEEILLTDAYACRDHSRGPRDMAPYKNHAWINGLLDNGVSFHLYAAHLIGREDLALSKAVVGRDGVFEPAEIRTVSFIASPADHGLTHRVLLKSESGELDVAITRAFGSIVTGVLPPFEAQAGMIPGERHITIFDEGVILDSGGVSGIGFCERGAAPTF